MQTPDSIYAAMQRASHREAEEQFIEALKQEERLAAELVEAKEVLRRAQEAYDAKLAEIEIGKKAVETVKTLLRQTHDRMLNPRPAPNKTGEETKKPANEDSSLRLLDRVFAETDLTTDAAIEKAKITDMASKLSPLNNGQRRAGVEG